MRCSEFSKCFCQAVFITSLCIGLLFSAHATEQTEISDKSTQQPLKVGIDPNLPPYIYLDDKGNVTGFEIELLREILKQQGIAYEFHPELWSINLKKLKNGEIDLHPSVMWTEPRERILDYSTVVAWFNITLFVRQGSAVKSISDLENGTILVERDTIWHAWLVENVPHLNLVLLDTSEEALSRLSAGEADAALMMYENGLYFQRKHKLNNIHSVGERIFEFESRIAFPEGSDTLRSKINDGIVHARENGTYDRCYVKWFAALEPTPWIANPAVKIISSIAALLFGTLALLAIWSRMLNHRVSEITEKYKSGQNELKLAQTAIDTIHDMVWIKDTKNNHITVNKSAAESVGFTIEELKGTNMMEHFPDEAEGFYQDDLEVIKTKKPKLGIIERISAKDEKLWISTDKHPIFDDENNVTGILVIVTDITEQKEVQSALEKTESQMKLAQTVIDTIHDMVWIKDTKNNHITVNKSAAESVGKTVEELKGSSAYEQFPEEAEGFYQDDLEVISSRKPKLGIIERLAEKDKNLWVSTDKYPIFDEENNVTGVLAIATNITKQKEVQNVLETREHVLAESEQLAQIGSWEHDIVNNLVHFSPGTLKIVDINTEKSVLPYDESFIVVHPEDRERVFYEYNQSVKNRAKYNITHRLLLRDGSIRYVNQICKTYYDEAGAPTRSVGVVRDITELKELELKSLQTQRQLAHVDRINTMGLLSSSIAHEINQPLSSISQFCSSAKLRLMKNGSNDEGLFGYLDSAIDQAQRAGEIIRRLRNLVNKQLPDRTVENINYIISESVAFLQNTLQVNQINIKLKLNNDVPTILLDSVQIQQVIINLIRNSIEATQSTSNQQREIEIQTVNYDEKYIQVVVQDNGPGVDIHMVDTLFDAYVSSHDDGLGLGLGLSICKTIIEAHEGSIRLDQDYNDGAKIIILLLKK